MDKFAYEARRVVRQITKNLAWTLDKSFCKCTTFCSSRHCEKGRRLFDEQRQGLFGRVWVGDNWDRLTGDTISSRFILVANEDEARVRLDKRCISPRNS
jgi:hypothetical protein